MLIEVSPAEPLGFAIACVLQNRAEAARSFLADHARAHPQFGDGSLTAAAGSLARHLSGQGIDLKLSAARARPAPDADRDPTLGALFLHPHWRRPAWARALTATALIGPFLFLCQPRAASENLRTAL